MHILLFYYFCVVDAITLSSCGFFFCSAGYVVYIQPLGFIVIVCAVDSKAILDEASYPTAW